MNKKLLIACSVLFITASCQSACQSKSQCEMQNGNQQQQQQQTSYSDQGTTKERPCCPPKACPKPCPPKCKCPPQKCTCPSRCSSALETKEEKNVADVVKEQVAPVAGAAVVQAPAPVAPIENIAVVKNNAVTTAPEVK